MMPGIQVCSDQSFVFIRSWASILSRDSLGHGSMAHSITTGLQDADFNVFFDLNFRKNNKNVFPIKKTSSKYP